MKSLAAGALALIGAVTSAGGATLLYEPFDYAAQAGPGALPGKTPDGTHTWVEAYNNSAAVDDAAVVAPGLTAPPGMAPSVGNRVQFGQTGRSYRIGFGGGDEPSSVSDGVIYYSMLLNVTSLNRGEGTSAVLPTSVGRQIALFSNGSTASSTSNLSVGFGTLWGRLAPDDTPGQSNTNELYHLGVSKTTATNTTVFATDKVFGPNDTVFVVVGYHRDAANEDFAELWLNPDPSTFGTANQPAPDITSALGTSDPASNQLLSGFGLYQNSTNSGSTFDNTGVNVDEIRIGLSWADVTPVPEPAAVGVLGVGAAMLLRRRRA